MGVLAQFRKATVSFIVSVRLILRMEQLGYHWTDFHENGYLRIFPKICRENSNFIKIGEEEQVPYIKT